MDRIHKFLVLLLLITLCLSCTEKEKPLHSGQAIQNFSSDSLIIKDAETNKIRGQVLYIPIYSNVPCRDNKLFDFSAFLAIHNTDLNKNIKITKVLYFDNDGKMVKDFITQEVSLTPLAAKSFFIPKSDKSGTGANFLVEWISESPVTEPLIESVMVDCETNYGMSFLSKGKVIREMK
jgi:hypothetical protein